MRAEHGTTAALERHAKWCGYRRPDGELDVSKSLRDVVRRGLAEAELERAERRFERRQARKGAK